MKVNVVIGTFLPFHFGHLDLIRFAHQFDTETPLHVIVSIRKKEPIKGFQRVNAVHKAFEDIKNIIVHEHVDDKAPQNPSSNDDPKFWDYWYNLIHTKINRDKKYNTPDDEVGTVFASEKYGKKLAAIFGANFVPFDVNRENMPISGTDIRKDIIGNWEYVAPTMRQALSTRVVVIGPESIGKTTISKALAETNGWVFVPEWARGYLETVGAELSFSKMNTIFKGQHALEQIVHEAADAPVLVHDTDLIATWAYHHISGILPISHEFTKLMTPLTEYGMGAPYNFGELYLLLSDELHFTADPLRYGGDKRESTNEYWEKLLLHFGVNYVKIPLGTIKETELRCRDVINAHLDAKFKALREFERE